MLKSIEAFIIILCVILTAFIILQEKQRMLPEQSNRVISTTAYAKIPTQTTARISGPVSYTAPASAGVEKPARVISSNSVSPATHKSMNTSTVSSAAILKWGAYVGDAQNNLSDFESLVGKPVNILAVFAGWDNYFPSQFQAKVGQKGKTLLIFWEPDFGYDSIIDGSHDDYIKKFASDAASYRYPVILVPFDEMNLNENAWGYGQNNNTAEKFITAWIHIHNLFGNAKNVKFGLAYNNVSVPDESGNQYKDYYPGDAYVDYVGVDGFNFNDPPQTFSQIFNGPIQQLQAYNKPIYIFSMADISGPGKDVWITDGLGSEIKNYRNLAGWIWFNQGGNPNWLIDSDSSSLQAFKSVLP